MFAETERQPGLLAAEPRISDGPGYCPSCVATYAVPCRQIYRTTMAHVMRNWSGKLSRAHASLAPAREQPRRHVASASLRTLSPVGRSFAA